MCNDGVRIAMFQNSGARSAGASERVDLRRSFEEKDREGICQPEDRWWHSCLRGFYDSLTLNDSPQAADLILVMAGRMERKHYGLELFRAGIAPRLTLSVGRFEVSKMRNFAIEDVNKLIAIRDKLPPHERNFFVTLDSSGTRIEKARLRRCSTYGEALALAEFLKREKLQSVIVVSTDVHLRRVSLVFRRVFRRTSIRFFYCGVPLRLTGLRRDSWWMERNHRRFVVKEMMKLIGYRLILMTPSWICRRLMRLKALPIDSQKLPES